MNFLRNIRHRNIDLYIYSALIFLYGVGWDYVLDRSIEGWSIVGVISYTAFVLILFTKNQQTPVKPELTGTIRPKTRLDYIGKLVVAAVVLGLLVYKLLSEG